MHKTDFSQNQISSSWSTLVTSQLTAMEVKFLCCETQILVMMKSIWFLLRTLLRQAHLHNGIELSETNLSLSKTQQRHSCAILSHVMPRPARSIHRSSAFLTKKQLLKLLANTLSASQKGWLPGNSRGFHCDLSHQQRKPFTYERLDGGVER